MNVSDPRGLQDGLQQALHRTLQMVILKHGKCTRGQESGLPATQGLRLKVSACDYFNMDMGKGATVVRMAHGHVASDRYDLHISTTSERPAHRVAELCGAGGAKVGPHIYQLDYYYL